MAVEWQESPLSNLIEVKHGFAFQGEFFRDSPPGEVLLTPGNFAIGGGFKPDKLKYYYGPVPEGFILSENDLLITMTDLSKMADTLGFPLLVPSPYKGRRFLHNQRLGKVLINQDAQLEKRFLYYLLCSREYRNEIMASATGTTVKHTSPFRIKAFKFKRPPLPEQRAIAHILGTLDDKIELNRQINQTLEAIAQALFKNWFVDFEPFRAQGMQESSLGEIPVGWKVSIIGNEVLVVGGSTPSTKISDYWDNGTYCWATPKDLSNVQSPILLDTERHVTKEGIGVIASGLLPTGAVLLSSRAPIGYLALASCPTAINQGFIGMVCNQQLNKHFVYLWTKYSLSTIKGRANGTTFPEISKKNFRDILVIVPSTTVCNIFTKIVEPLFSLIENNLKQSEKLKIIRESLLPKLISGEIRITDAERFIERRI